MKDLPIPEADPVDVDRQIKDILDAPEYDYSEPWYRPITDWILDIISDVAGWIGRRISDFFGLFGGLGIGGVGGAGLLGKIIGFTIIGALILLIARLIWRAVQSRLPKPVSYDQEPVVEIGRWFRPKELLADAERFEKEERWDEALRARYRYVIAELVERKLIDNPPGRTTGEYKGEVEHWLPASAAGFSTITGTFEHVWYGEQPANQAMVDQLRRTGDEVLEAAKSAPKRRDDRELVG